VPVLPNTVLRPHKGLLLNKVPRQALLNRAQPPVPRSRVPRPSTAMPLGLRNTVPLNTERPSKVLPSRAPHFALLRLWPPVPPRDEPRDLPQRRQWPRPVPRRTEVYCDCS
tara:strand:+ start:65970 stop:66302 length:333 start_codon:yes stop_codon:yes gene_type:complete